MAMATGDDAETAIGHVEYLARKNADSADFADSAAATWAFGAFEVLVAHMPLIWGDAEGDGTARL